jgi:hypothetical protein
VTCTVRGQKRRNQSGGDSSSTTRARLKPRNDVPEEIKLQDRNKFSKMCLQLSFADECQSVRLFFSKKSISTHCLPALAPFLYAASFSRL